MSSKAQTTQRTNAATPMAQELINRILMPQIMGPGWSPANYGGAGQPTGVPGPFMGGVNYFRQQNGMDPLSPGGYGSPAQIQGSLDQGAFGTGFGPLQQHAGTAIQQYLNSGMQLPKAWSNAIRGEQQNVMDLATKNQQEQFGAAGNLMGTAGAVGRARLLAQLAPAFTNQYFQQQQAQGQQYLQGLQQEQNFGYQNLLPFLQIASQGLLAPNVTQTESPWVTGLGLLTGAAKGAGSILAAT